MLLRPQQAQQQRFFVTLGNVGDNKWRALEVFGASASSAASEELVRRPTYQEMCELMSNARIVGTGTDTIAVLRLPDGATVLRICEVTAGLMSRQPVVRELFIGAEVRELQAAELQENRPGPAPFLIGIDSFALVEPPDAPGAVSRRTTTLLHESEIAKKYGPSVELTDTMPEELARSVHMAVLRPTNRRPEMIDSSKLCKDYAARLIGRWSETNRFSYYVFERQRYVDGVTLEQVLTNPRQRVTALRAVYVIVQQLVLLYEKYRFVHRDLQSRNIILEQNNATVFATAAALLRTALDAPLDSAYAGGVPVFIDLNHAYIASVSNRLKNLGGPKPDGVSGAEDMRRLGLYILHAWYTHPIDDADPSLENCLADALLFRVAERMVALTVEWACVAYPRPPITYELLFRSWNPKNKTVTEFVECYRDLHSCLVASGKALATLTTNGLARTVAPSASVTINKLIHDFNYYSQPVISSRAHNVAGAEKRYTPAALLPELTQIVASLDRVIAAGQRRAAAAVPQ